jgi:hypothetical protein
VVTRTNSPFAYASLGKLCSGDKIYYGDTIEVYYQGAMIMPIKGYLSGEYSTFRFTLDGLNSNRETPSLNIDLTPAYLSKMAQNISLPADLKTAAPILK